MISVLMYSITIKKHSLLGNFIQTIYRHALSHKRMRKPEFPHLKWDGETIQHLQSFILRNSGKTFHLSKAGFLSDSFIYSIIYSSIFSIRIRPILRISIKKVERLILVNFIQLINSSTETDCHRLKIFSSVTSVSYTVLSPSNPRLQNPKFQHRLKIYYHNITFQSLQELLW